MYSDFPHLNAFCALLTAHDVRRAVVCPGSRNAPIAHNLWQMQSDVDLFPITDERSAAFAALGMCVQSSRPAMVCVTSGSALLNTLPAVAEARERHLPLLVVSADREPELIGQLDGQTLPQQGALEPYAHTFNLPTASGHRSQFTGHNLRYAIRVANEALVDLQRDGGGPVHVNIPLESPLYSFRTDILPPVYPLKVHSRKNSSPIPAELIDEIAASPMPILVLGQLDAGPIDAVRAIDVGTKMLVLPELISGQHGSGRVAALEDVRLEAEGAVIVHIGGNLIDKPLKTQLRQLGDAKVVRIQEDSRISDTFFHLTDVVRGNPLAALEQLAADLPANERVREERARLVRANMAHREADFDDWDDLGVMARLSEALADVPLSALHLGNSLVLRNAAKCIETDGFRVSCNRGTNGIEGSLSAAAGYALIDDGLNVVLIGDLSFFYDSNALWNERLGGNLRIILFNNSGGGIFRQVKGAIESPAFGEYIAAHHDATAEGICLAYGAHYFAARTFEELGEGFEEVLHGDFDRPALLEIFL